MRRPREEDKEEDADPLPQLSTVPEKIAQAALRATLMPEALRREVVFNFDGERHDIRGLVSRILLGDSAQGSDLATLHLDSSMTTSCTQGRPALVNKRWRNRGVAKDKYTDEFRFRFGLFMEEVVCKELGCESAVFQQSPVLRCHTPGLKPLGHPHRDEMYNRQPCEVNIWLPLTPVFGNNSLWAESSRDAGDFHPFVAEWGQAVRFWGNQVMHMTKANDTPNTRVSLDCRIVPTDLYVNDYVSPLSKSGRVANRLGQGYTNTTLERAWRARYRPPSTSDAMAHRPACASDAMLLVPASENPQESKTGS